MVINTLLSVKNPDNKKSIRKNDQLIAQQLMGTLFKNFCLLLKLIDQRTQRPSEVNTETITSYFPLLLNTDPFIYMPDRVPQDTGTAYKNNA